MSSDHAPAPRGGPRLDLDEGPLADALLAVDRALVDIETAKATLTTRRHDFARVFREQVAAHAGDDDQLAAELRDVIGALYWEHPTLRLADLSAATGLDNQRVRRLAGPRVVEVACVGCGGPTRVLQTRRAERAVGRCPDCRRPDPDLDPYRGAVPWDPPPPATSMTMPVGPTWLARLLDHLEARLQAVDCDHQLTLTRRWAMREGIDQRTVIAAVEAFGGSCDCEVAMNAPPTAQGPA